MARAIQGGRIRVEHRAGARPPGGERPNVVPVAAAAGMSVPAAGLAGPGGEAGSSPDPDARNRGKNPRAADPVALGAAGQPHPTPPPPNNTPIPAVSGPSETQGLRSGAPPVAEQVVRTARIVLADGLTQMEVRLDPPALGAIRVTAAAGAAGISVSIAADRPETQALLLQAIPEMQTLLASRGMPAASIAVASTFDPPDQRRAPARRDSDRGGRFHEPPNDPRRTATVRRPVATVDLTV